jgi:DNA-directed RNA polymerase subunit omega
LAGYRQASFVFYTKDERKAGKCGIIYYVNCKRKKRPIMKRGKEMIHPPINDLLKQVDDKYTLAILGAKRAREIVDGNTPLVDSKSSKPVTIAFEEIAQRKITYVRTQNGIK